MEYRDRQNELTELAFSDNSSGWDIDEVGIYTDGNVFYVLSASGCSCWDGDYDEEVFSDFESLKNSFINEDRPRWSPGLVTARAMIKEVEEKLGLA